MWIRKLGQDWRTDSWIAVVRAIYQEEQLVLVFCDASRESPHDRGDYRCSRPKDHTGRHVALAFNIVCAAWPDDHEPTVEDL